MKIATDENRNKNKNSAKKEGRTNGENLNNEKNGANVKNLNNEENDANKQRRTNGGIKEDGGFWLSARDSFTAQWSTTDAHLSTPNARTSNRAFSAGDLSPQNFKARFRNDFESDLQASQSTLKQNFALL